jgi:hypothetical protein
MIGSGRNRRKSDANSAGGHVEKNTKPKFIPGVVNE